MKIEKGVNSFKVLRSDKQIKREVIKEKKTPTNREIADLLEMILVKLEGE